MRVSKKILIVSLVCFVLLLSLTFCLKKFFLKPKEIVKAKVAIVIDDWGYNLRYLKLLREIDIPLTISILPNLRYSSKIAQIAQDTGREIILHLPLQPALEGRERIGLEKNTITKDMSEEEIIQKFALALSSVPYAKGASNHMGSEATKDERLMSVVFAQLKKKGFFFLDNLVTGESICRQLARKMKLKFASRTIFLDNKNNNEYIKGQFRQLTESALKNKNAVGIGHSKLKTLQVLKDQIPLMQAQGIKFVFVSELIN